MTRAEFSNKFPSIRNWLLINNRNLFDKILPRQFDFEAKKERLLNLVDKPKTGMDKNTLSRLGPGGSHYDPDFIKLLKRLKPAWYPDNPPSFCRMLKRMPKTIKFKEGQVWIGIDAKYIFIHETFGEFTLNPRQSSKGSAWKNGRSGHPEDKSKLTSLRKSKSVKNVETGEIFASARAASLSLGLNKGQVSNSINSDITCGGYHWAYCDENGKVIDNKKKKK